MKNLKLLGLLILSFIALGLSAEDNKLKAFKTDGCTMFLDGTCESPGLWKDCCIEHDLRYWYGGTLSDLDDADNQIKVCVEKVAGHAWAQVIYTGIRAGHYSPIKNQYQWSWGWTKNRKNTQLTDEESIYVLNELKILSINKEINLEEFIRRNFPNL